MHINIKNLFHNHSDDLIKVEKIENKRSRCKRCSMTKGILRNFKKFTGKVLC